MATDSNEHGEAGDSDVRSAAAPAPRRAGGDASPRGARKGSGGGRRGKRKPKGGSAVMLFLLFGIAPAALVAYFFTLPEATRQTTLDKIPDGVAGRATKAGILMLALIVLAKVALPAFHGASGYLQGLLTKFRSNPMGMRILLFPLEMVVGLLWFLMQICFAIDAVLIVAAALGALLATARILKPDLLPGFVPQLSAFLGWG